MSTTNRTNDTNDVDFAHFAEIGVLNPEASPQALPAQQVA